MRILTVDIGNTAVKGSVFEEGCLLGSTLLETRDPSLLLPLVGEFAPQGAICCCTGSDAEDFTAELESLTGLQAEMLSHATPLPIRIEYTTPSTLGLDRVAAAAGASLRGGEILVADAGTAVTLDLVAGDTFLGGNISPGLGLRFRSLNKFTSRLPLIGPQGELPAFGHDTATAIRAGVVRGMVAEIADTFRRARRRFPHVRMLLTGGDADFLAPLIEEAGVETEICHSLVGEGLERIYLHMIAL